MDQLNELSDEAFETQKV